MKYYSYVITRDYGFAPNPYFGFCTLATCKPKIRKNAQIGDWVGAFGGVNSEVSGCLVMLMKVTETMTFDEYWSDSRFACKKPVLSKGMTHMYGDNIYHHVQNEWFQELSHHSNLDGSINYLNLERDTSADCVLISSEFYYFGNRAISVPNEYDDLIGRGRADKVNRDEEHIREFIQYVGSNYSMGINGIPFSRQVGVFSHYRGR